MAAMAEFDLQTVLNSYTEKELEALQFKLIDYDDVKGNDGFTWMQPGGITLLTLSGMIRFSYRVSPIAIAATGDMEHGELYKHTAADLDAWRKFSMGADICQFFLHAAFGLAGTDFYTVWISDTWEQMWAIKLYRELSKINTPAFRANANPGKALVQQARATFSDAVMAKLVGSGGRSKALYTPVLEHFEKVCDEFLGYLTQLEILQRVRTAMTAGIEAGANPGELFVKKARATLPRTVQTAFDEVGGSGAVQNDAVVSHFERVCDEYLNELERSSSTEARAGSKKRRFSESDQEPALPAANPGFSDLLQNKPFGSPPPATSSFLDLIRGQPFRGGASPFARAYFDCPFRRECVVQGVVGRSEPRENAMGALVLEADKVYDFYAYADNAVLGATPASYIKWVDPATTDFVYFPTTVPSINPPHEEQQVFGPETTPLNHAAFFMEYAFACKNGEFLFHGTEAEDGKATMDAFLSTFWAFLRKAADACVAANVCYTDWKVANIGIANLRYSEFETSLVKKKLSDKKKSANGQWLKRKAAIVAVREEEVTAEMLAHDRQTIAEYQPRGPTVDLGIQLYGKPAMYADNFQTTFIQRLKEARAGEVQGVTASNARLTVATALYHHV